jgi:hypothetical protein
MTFMMKSGAGSIQGMLAIIWYRKKLKIKIYKDIVLLVMLDGCETWSLTLRKEHRLRFCEKIVLRRIFGPKSEEDGSWRKLHNDELHGLYFSLPISFRSILTLSSYLCLGLASGPFPLGFESNFV